MEVYTEALGSRLISTQVDGNPWTPMWKLVEANQSRSKTVEEMYGIKSTSEQSHGRGGALFPELLT